jgi:hypothetical protein
MLVCVRAWCTGVTPRVVRAVERLSVPERGRPAQMMPSPEAKHGARVYEFVDSGMAVLCFCVVRGEWRWLDLQGSWMMY